MDAQRLMLPDGRWHFQHGPIDIVVGADGHAAAVAHAHEVAWQRFRQVLAELVSELPQLRQPVHAMCGLSGVVARRMWHACLPFSDQYITPMAAVAGAVAEELLPAYQSEGVVRAWVNNGGDIALHLTPGQHVRIGLFADLAQLDRSQLMQGLRLDGNFDVTFDHPVRGVATSGWRGRSFSLGIADSVTVLAATAAQADAAATIIGNAVNVDDPRILRSPACELVDNSDLGDMAVTVDVPELAQQDVQFALAQGRQRAQQLMDGGLIQACILSCQGRLAVTLATALQPLSRGSINTDVESVDTAMLSFSFS